MANRKKPELFDVRREKAAKVESLTKGRKSYGMGLKIKRTKLTKSGKAVDSVVGRANFGTMY